MIALSLYLETNKKPEGKITKYFLRVIMNETVMNLKKPIIYLFSILLSPTFFGLIIGAINLYSYNKFGGSPDLPPRPGWIIYPIMSIGVISGLFCVIMVIRLLSRRLLPSIIFAIPCFAFGFFKCFAFESEFVSFMGYTCCRAPATFFSLIEVAISPIVFFWRYNPIL